MKEKSNLIGVVLLLLIILFVIAVFRENSPENGECVSDNSQLFLLGSNLGAWDNDWYWKVNEPLVKNSKQRELAKGVIGSFRFSCRDLSDEALLEILEKIEETGAEPFVVLPADDDQRAQKVVELFGDRVDYYEYGNEVGWWIGMAPEEHAERMCEAIPKLKEINPNAKIGGNAQGDSDPVYMRRFLIHMKNTCPDITPDFVSFHKYWAYTSESSQDILNRVEAFDQEIEALRDVNIEVHGQDLPIIISEWNWHAVPENYEDNRDMDGEFMREFTRNVIDEMREADVYMAHQYCYGSGCGDGHLDMISGSNPKPQYQVFSEEAEKLCSD
jgi:hypothetical protein